MEDGEMNERGGRVPLGRTHASLDSSQLRASGTVSVRVIILME
jgi:hypothetical protein